jgi:hypothetical protein
MRPDCAGRSDRLLNVGPPKVAARLSLGESIEGGDPWDTVEVGDIGSGTGVAGTDKYLYVVCICTLLTRWGCRRANMVG